MKQENDFEFNYNAPTNEERKEIESIKNKYSKEHSSSTKLNELRKLDNKVKNTPTIISLIFGVVGILILGTGMSMILEWQIILWGIVVSVFGIIPTALAYPIYKITLATMKNKHAKQIIKLSEELLNEQQKNEK